MLLKKSQYCYSRWLSHAMYVYAYERINPFQNLNVVQQSHPAQAEV